LYEIEENPEIVAAYRLARRDAEKYYEVRDFTIMNPTTGANYSNSFYADEGAKLPLDLRMRLANEFHEKLGLQNPILRSPGTGITSQQIFDML
jgi:hypothetical protein